MPTGLALSLFDPKLQDAVTQAPPVQVLDFLLGPYDLKRLTLPPLPLPPPNTP